MMFLPPEVRRRSGCLTEEEVIWDFGVKTRKEVMGASFEVDSFRGTEARAEASPQGDSAWSV